MNYLRVLLAAVAALVTFFAWGFLTEGCRQPSTAHQTCR
jgi:hypothetical protein